MKRLLLILICTLMTSCVTSRYGHSSVSYPGYFGQGPMVKQWKNDKVRKQIRNFNNCGIFKRH